MKGISSWRSPKVYVGKSNFKGKGLFAKKAIAKDELIAVKGGHIMDRELFASLPKACKHAALQVARERYLAPLEEKEIEQVMVYINHTCEPNVGLRGHLDTIALRDIRPGEELTADYCIAYSNTFFEFDCHCGSPLCRGKVTSEDWKDKKLQQKYAGYFCQYLQDMIAQETAVAAK